MTAGFFRAAATDHRRRLHGTVVITQPIGYRAIIAISGCFVIAGLILLLTGSYTRKETVHGYIFPSGGIAQLYASKGGTVARVLAREGDTVSQGQPLVELSLETGSVDGPVSERLRQETETRLSAVEVQVAAAGSHQESEVRRLSARSDALKSEIASLKQRIDAERQVLALEVDDRERYRQLEVAGTGSHIELSRREQRVFAQRSAIYELDRQREERQEDFNEAQLQLAALPSQLSEKLAQLASQRSEIKQSLTQQDVTNRSYVVTAPVAGKIAALQALPGQTYDTRSPLAALIPAGSELEATLLVPSRAVGLIQQGQEVKLKIDAFPYQRFGTVSGHVAQISRTTYREGELLAAIPFHDSVYRVVVSLNRTSITVYGDERPLTSGMTLVGDIITDRLHFTDWILDPLRAGGHRQ